MTAVRPVLASIGLFISASAWGCAFWEGFQIDSKFVLRYCGNKLQAVTATGTAEIEFGVPVSQIFFTPQRRMLLVRSGERVGFLSGTKLTFLSHFPGLKRVVPLNNGDALLLSQKGKRSVVAYAARAGLRSEVYSSSSNVLDIAVVRAGELVLLAEDGGLQTIDLESKATVKQAQLPDRPTRLISDVDEKSFWVMGYKSLHRCAAESMKCSSASLTGQLPEVTHQAGGGAIVSLR